MIQDSFSDRNPNQVEVSRMPKREGTKKALVNRVKKAVKKSRRRLGAEKFEKELTRTITFLENLQRKVATLASSGAAADKPAGKTTRRPARKAGTRKSPRKAAATRTAPAGRAAATAKKK